MSNRLFDSTESNSPIFVSATSSFSSSCTSLFIHHFFLVQLNLHVEGLPLTLDRGKRVGRLMDKKVQS